MFDEETGLYYLRTRYYNSEWARFVNADILLGKPGVVLSCNMFTYCRNAPVNRAAPNGLMDIVFQGIQRIDIPSWLTRIIAGLIISEAAKTIAGYGTDIMRTAQSLKDKIDEKKFERDERVRQYDEATQGQKTDGIFYHAILLDGRNGITTLPRDISFLEALITVKAGGDVWTPSVEDAVALGTVSVLIDGGRLEGPKRDSGVGCHHFHIYDYQGKKSQAHLFFGSEGVVYMDFGGMF